MAKRIELPLGEPFYSTYQYQIPGMAVAAGNPSMRNWYLNELMHIGCARRFLSPGYSSPDIHIRDASWEQNPHLEIHGFEMWFLKGYANPVIRELLDNGFYVYYTEVDDFYVEGKSWYRERHFGHDGLICGYDQEDKTYCLYGYDTNWILRKFWTPQQGFNRGREAMFRQNRCGCIYGVRDKGDVMPFSWETAIWGIAEYLDSSLEKYPEDGEGLVYGIVTHEYILKYLRMLADGAISYERMDPRVFRLVWEHKKGMLERITCIEKALELEPDFSRRYAPLVKQADDMRMLYAAYHMRRRDELLPVLQEKLRRLKDTEADILTALVLKAKEGIGT